MSQTACRYGATLAAGLALVLAGCTSETPPRAAASGNPAAATGQSATDTGTLICRLYKPDGERCVSQVQQPMRPAVAGQGYATQLSWVLTNECTYPMQVSWGWTPGTTVGQTVLTQGQSTEIGCLWNYDEGCEGGVDWVYRCSEIQ